MAMNLKNNKNKIYKKLYWLCCGCIAVIIIFASLLLHRPSYYHPKKSSDNTAIAFGQNDWVIDIEAGQLTFYAGLPSGVSGVQPPKVTFWKYIGPKGFPTGSSTASYVDTVDGGFF